MRGTEAGALKRRLGPQHPGKPSGVRESPRKAGSLRSNQRSPRAARNDPPERESCGREPPRGKAQESGSIRAQEEPGTGGGEDGPCFRSQVHGGSSPDRHPAGCAARVQKAPVRALPSFGTLHPHLALLIVMHSDPGCLQALFFITFMVLYSSATAGLTGQQWGSALRFCLVLRRCKAGKRAGGSTGRFGARGGAVVESLPGALLGQGGSGSCSLPGEPGRGQHRAGSLRKEEQDFEDSSVHRGLGDFRY
ncbi:hypothetical protein NDU88_005291 [Pleurodeles waltl]|uniref:Uncharacterized protein n=1 Tax=Pleurodeles waltl TaxID=8319 RepID=A0AAV7UHL6_PLEWA|nr:hypothetical protein NDU88_005291 [Pleurodeles waltl]